jgi:hypothetical protein
MTILRNLTHDFVRRTKSNLETIERLAIDNPKYHYEVTQLINSCVGLLFVPTEDQIDRLRHLEIYDFLGEIEPPRVLHGALRHENAAGLVRYLRNAFAHLNFDFQSRNNRIVGVYLWNMDEGHKVNWVAYIQVENLRKMLDRLAEQYVQSVPSNSPNQQRLARLEEQLGRTIRLTNGSGM